MTPEFAPGIHNDMPAEHYHATEAMSSGGAKKMLASPAHYKLMRDTANAPSAAMLLGTGVHTLTLEPHRAGEIVCMPEFNNRTNAGKAERDAWLAENAGKQAFSPEDYTRVINTHAAIRAHPGAATLLSDGKAEVSLMWRDVKYDVPCKSRYDWIRADGGLVDLKTTKVASADGFKRTIANFMYHVQAAFYWSGYEHMFDRSPAFWAFVAAETEPPHGVACYVLQEDAIRAGMRHVETALRRYRECLDAGRWPGYSEEIQPISVPKYALTFQE